MKVLVTGGAGFLGRAIVRAVNELGAELTLVLRRPSAPALPEQTVVHRRDLLRVEPRDPVFAGQTAVVHAAVDYGSPERSLEMTRRVAAACRAHGVGRLVLVSSHNAGFRAPGAYSAGKREAERLVQHCGVDWVILRPTLLYDDSGGPFLTGLIRVARRLRVIPVLGRGDSLLQPAHARDVAAIAVAAISCAPSKVVAVAGRVPVSLRQLAEGVRTALGGGLVLTVPLPALRPVAALHRGLRDRLRELSEDKTITAQNMQSVQDLLGRAPRALLEDLPSIVAAIR